MAGVLPTHNPEDLRGQDRGDAVRTGGVTQKQVRTSSQPRQVRGHLFDEGVGLRLCESLIGLGERYGCEGRYLAVANLDVTLIAEIVYFEGTTYTEDAMTVFGQLVNGVLVVDPFVAG